MIIRALAWIASLLVAVVLTWFVVAAMQPSEMSELFNKREWSVVEAAAARHRSIPVHDVILINDFDNTIFDIVGIPTKDDSGVWIMTNARGVPRIKLMNYSKFHISSATYEEIKTLLDINDDVNVLLKNAIAEE